MNTPKIVFYPRLIIEGVIITIIGSLLFIDGLSDAKGQAGSFHERKKDRFTIITYDSLELPARQINTADSIGKVIIFIGGSTPYDENGYQAAMWLEENLPLREKSHFYQRFLEVLPLKGYSVITLAKRSFVYPNKLPRAGLDDYAMDIVSLIRFLKKQRYITENDQLVITGYSEGSLVATKVAGLLKKPPHAIILLGSGSLAFNYQNGR